MFKIFLIVIATASVLQAAIPLTPFLNDSDSLMRQESPSSTIGLASTIYYHHDFLSENFVQAKLQINPQVDFYSTLGFQAGVEQLLWEEQYYSFGLRHKAKFEASFWPDFLNWGSVYHALQLKRMKGYSDLSYFNGPSLNYELYYLFPKGSGLGLLFRDLFSKRYWNENIEKMDWTWTLELQQRFGQRNLTAFRMNTRERSFSLATYIFLNDTYSVWTEMDMASALFTFEPGLLVNINQFQFSLSQKLRPGFIGSASVESRWLF